MIDHIQQLGLLPDLSAPGETRADGAWPAMLDATQLSHNRWLTICTTRGWLHSDDGFLGNDNDRAVLWQLHQDSPLGPIIKEGVFAHYREDWDALSDGTRCLAQHCHAGTFGVPKGARVNGKHVPHENVFVASWYKNPRTRGTGPHDVPTHQHEADIFKRAFQIEWVQFRLADSSNDIQILQAPSRMRQLGYESGPAFCSLEPGITMNKWYVKPVPYNADNSQWVQIPHFSRGLAAIRLKFNPALGYYQWTQTGPLFAVAPTTPDFYFTETSIVSHNSSWLVSVRVLPEAGKPAPGTAWLRTDDLFKPLPQPFYPGAPLSKSPTAAYRCPDGVLRLLTNDSTLSPYGNDRDPLYIWDVDPDNNYALSNRHVVYDSLAAKIPVSDDCRMRVDMPNLFPHAGGREQTIATRIRIRRKKQPFMRLTQEERDRTGIYLSRITYRDELPPAWQFA